jgi:hypothetical protein
MRALFLVTLAVLIVVARPARAMTPDDVEVAVDPGLMTRPAHENGSPLSVGMEPTRAC